MVDVNGAVNGGTAPDQDEYTAELIGGPLDSQFVTFPHPPPRSTGYMTLGGGGVDPCCYARDRMPDGREVWVWQVPEP